MLFVNVLFANALFVVNVLSAILFAIVRLLSDTLLVILFVVLFGTLSFDDALVFVFIVFHFRSASDIAHIAAFSVSALICLTVESVVH